MSYTQTNTHPPPPPPQQTKNETTGSGPPTFDVDLTELERRYKALLWALHPDRAAGRPPEERGYGAAGAARLNTAYGVLRRPLSRANYLVRFCNGRAWQLGVVCAKS
jgi:DnaJ-domain-containing protein 1